jgi:hypothetical protein
MPEMGEKGENSKVALDVSAKCNRFAIPSIPPSLGKNENGAKNN